LLQEGFIEAAFTVCAPELPRIGVPRWFVIEAERGKTTVAKHAITSRGLTVFQPLQTMQVKEQIRGHWTGRYVWADRPLFFSFLFCQFDPETDDWPRRDTRLGIKRLLMTSRQRPAPVEVGLVEALMATAADRAAVPSTELARLVKGASVRIKAPHPFAGHSVVVESCNGLTTTGHVFIFGTQTDVMLRRSDLEG